MKESIKHIFEISAGISCFMLLLAVFICLGSDSRGTNYFAQMAITPLLGILIISLLVLTLINTNIVKKIIDWVNK